MDALDKEISRAHTAAEEAENQARQLEARIARIPGAARLLPLRRYGAPVDPAEVRKNLTLSSLIARHDHELAAYLGCASGEHRRREEEAAAAALQAEALRLKTQQAKAQNEAAAAQRYREQLTPLPMGWRR
jgi:hypothetical protein